MRSKPSSPRGFDEEVQRMRIANQEREAKAKLLSEIGKPKLGTDCRTAAGLTTIKPF